MTPEQQNILETALPFIAYLVSYLIQQAHWSAKVNTTVASITILLAAFATLFIQHKFTGNVFADFLAIAALAAGLQSQALSPLAQWLKTNAGATPPQEGNTPTTLSARPTASDWTKPAG